MNLTIVYSIYIALSYVWGKGEGGRALHGQTMYAYYIGTTAVWRWMNHEEAASMLLKLMSTVVLG